MKGLSEMVKVRSFNYRSITLSYGPSHDAYVIVRYSVEKKRFTLNFGEWVLSVPSVVGGVGRASSAVDGEDPRRVL